MRILIVASLGILFLSGAGFLILRSTKPSPAQHQTAPSQPSTSAASVVAAPPITEVTRPTLPRPPVALTDFWNKSTHDQTVHVTDLVTNTELPIEIVRFLESVVPTHGLDSVLRNNSAVALLNQTEANPRLEPLFLAMAQDQSDSIQMREYALQYLARSAERAVNPSRAVAYLMRAARSQEGGIPGTALLHLDRLESNGICTLGGEYDSLVRTILRDPRADLLSSMTALNLVGQRKMADDLPYVRELAAGPVVALRRIALAVLGQIGDEHDADVLSRAAADADPTIALAASTAHQRLQTR